VNRDYTEMFEAIDACYFRSLVIPCLVLVYTAIDSLGWLAYGHEQQRTRARFVRWVDRYLLPRLDTECTAIDLYAARCSILHGLAAESDLSKARTAKKLMYAMGKNTGSVPEMSKTMFSDKDTLCIRVDGLIAHLRDAVRGFFNEAKSDPQLRERIGAARQKTYAVIPLDLYSKLAETLEILSRATDERGPRTTSSDEREGL
jgi:hypothetical protein